MRRVARSLRRLTPDTVHGRMILGTAVIVAGIAAFMWLYFPQRLEREAMRASIEKAVSMSEMAAYTLAAALIFDDGFAIREVIDALRVDRQLAFVAITDAMGVRVGAGGTVPDGVLPVVGDAPMVSDGLLTVAAPIVSGAQPVGTIVIGFDLETLRRSAAETRRQVAFLAIVVFVLGLVGAGVVISVVQRLEDKRDQLEERLAHAQKMEAVGRLAGGIAHDFNNLLTTINGTAALALDAMPPDAPGRHDLEEIMGAGERAAALTSQLLGFSRKQMRQPRLLAVNSAVSGLESMLRRLIGETIVLHLDLSASDPHVQADPGQLDQVLMNLVVNARDAMPDGGTLRITTSLTAVDDALALELETRPGRFAVVGVEDTGHGMDAATLAMAFEPFFTTKDVGKGTGLGLSTVYGIVHQNGGAVRCASTPGVGTTFSILLPAVAAAVPEEAPRIATAPPEEPMGETILLVEDDDAVRNLAARVLRRSGYLVLEGRDGREGLEVASVHDGAIDALVTDVVMPEMGGPAMVRRMREARPALKVLFMSGYTRDEALAATMDEPGIEFLAKPMSPKELAAAVKALLRQSPVSVG